MYGKVSKLFCLIIYLLTVLPLLNFSHAQAAFMGSSSVTTTKFAGDENPIQRVHLNLHFKSQEIEIKSIAFLDMGQEADHSFDLEPAVFRWRLLESGHLWFGKTHPYGETRNGDAPRATDALGNHWAQNQSLPLHPRVSGWIGGGVKLNFSGGFYFLTAYSPLFLPHFGVRTFLSENKAPSGAHFARLPPVFVSLNDQTILPLRYRVQLPETRSILLQNQIFFLLGNENTGGTFSLMAWSAPDPAPELELTGIIKFQSNEPMGLVTVRPHFVRKTLVSLTWENKSLPLSPDFQIVYDLKSKQTTFSCSFLFKNRIKTGFLHSLGGIPLDASLPVSSPRYAKKLFWLEFFTPQPLFLLQPSLRWERHFALGEEGDWIEALLKYQPVSNVVLFASLNLLTGQDRSYYGGWRSLDSLSTGFQWIW